MMDLLPLLAEAAPVAGEAVAGAVKESSAGLRGSISLAIAGMGSAIGVGLIGSKAVEAVGRNPQAFGNILTLAIIGMALAEAIAIYALLVVFVKGF